MSRGIPITAAVIVLSLGASAVLADEAPKPAKAATITVNVGTFRNQKGALGCRLYRSSAGFPEGTAGTLERRVALAASTAQCRFEGVLAGTYAVSVMHDENDNQRLDKNFLGIPTEGYGVSNNHTHAMSSPTWDESKFTVEPGKDVSLSIGLRY